MTRILRPGMCRISVDKQSGQGTVEPAALRVAVVDDASDRIGEQHRTNTRARSTCPVSSVMMAWPPIWTRTVRRGLRVRMSFLIETPVVYWRWPLPARERHLCKGHADGYVVV